MKKFLFTLFCAVLGMTSYAQRIAVLDFNAGVGISQADVDGISAIFNTYFSPNGYTLVERTRINNIIDEQNLQRGRITEQQMVHIGQILNVSKIVIGDVNIVAGQYNVDVRVVNVQAGTIAAKEGATWTQGSSYRTMMQNLATRLANKIAVNPVSSKPANTVTPAASTQPKTTPTPPPAPTPAPTPTPGKRASVEVLYGYLKIFPNDLGEFESVPSTVIAQINKTNQYGCNTWRVPAKEELALLRANGYLGNGRYLSREEPAGVVLLVSDLEPSYFVGDYYDRDGKKGIVFEVNTTGTHGKIVSIEETRCNWHGAKTWCGNLGDGWYLPNKQELKQIYTNKQAIMKTLEERRLGQLKDVIYWSSDQHNIDHAWVVGILNGRSYDLDIDNHYYVRAVSAF